MRRLPPSCRPQLTCATLRASQIKIFTSAPALVPAMGVAGFCFCTVLGLPRLTTAVPSSLAGLVLATALGAALNLPLATLADAAGGATFAGGLASLPTVVDLGALLALCKSLPAVRLVLPTAVSIAFISILETLLSGPVLTRTSRGAPVLNVRADLC